MSALKLPETGRIAGIVTTSELVTAGLSDRQIRCLVRLGDLHLVARGVYADGAKARDMLELRGGRQLLELAATVAAVGPRAIVSHESAAYLHTIDLLAWPDGAASLTYPPLRTGRPRAGVRLHAATVPPEQITSVVGLRVTTPGRTVVDLARTLEFRAGVVAADSALHKRLVTKPELQAVLGTCSQWRGARRAAEVIAFADVRAESPLESIARVAFSGCGLPPPELQVWLGGTIEPIGRVDFYEVVHFTWDQISNSPERVAASVRAAFRRGVRNATRPGRPDSLPLPASARS